MDAPETTPQQILDRMEAALGEPSGEPLRRFCSEFAPYLEHFGEFGVQMPSRAMAALTLGCGRAFGQRIADFLVSTGLEVEAASRIIALQELVDDWMLVRISTGPGGTAEAGLYFRKAMTVEAGMAVLARLEVSAPEQEAVREMADLLGSGRIGILGARLAAGEPPLYSVYLHAYEEGPGTLRDRLERTFAHFRLPEARWSTFLERMHGGGPDAARDAFVSLLVADGAPFDSLKLDYFQASIPGLERVLRASGILAPDDTTLSRAGMALGVSAVEHVGLRFGADGVRWSFYVAPDLAPRAVLTGTA